MDCQFLLLLGEKYLSVNIYTSQEISHKNEKKLHSTPHQFFSKFAMKIHISAYFTITSWIQIDDKISIRGFKR